MKIATWNVNSLKVRLPHLLGWLADFAPDVVCLQELKGENEKFPRAEIEAAGYQAVFSGQKTYNGVAILVRSSSASFNDVAYGNPHYPDENKRLIAANVTPASRDGQQSAPVRVVCAYFPNGQEVGSEKYAYKMAWLAGLIAWIGEEIKQYPRLVLAGDFNIAPEDRDVYDPQLWQGKILCSDDERAAFKRLIGLGLVDTFRLFEQGEGFYSWWDYRQAAFRRNLGLRIDHLLASEPLARECISVGIDKTPRKLERPSDHAPAWFELGK